MIKEVVKKMIGRKTNVSAQLSLWYAEILKNTVVEDNSVFYECRDGKSMTDSPYALFKYLINSAEYQHLQHIWTYDPEADGWEKQIDKYKAYSNVHFVERNTRAYVACISKAKFLVNNSTFQAFFVPMKEQVCINTWHGIPLKKMGYEIQTGNPAGLQNVVRNLFFADYLLSPDPHTTRMYTDSFKLAGAYEGEILELGYPRIDLTSQADTKELFEQLHKDQLDIENTKPIVLYCPTWKGTNVTKPKNQVAQLIAESNLLREKIGSNYNVLVKVHPFLYPFVKDDEQLKPFLIPDYFDSNELMAIVDILVTDYSSIFFDYMITEKPIIFYAWDKEIYEGDRGLYFTDDELPGPVTTTIAEVIDCINNIEKVKVDYENRYQAARARFLPHEDNHSTERVISYIFSGKKPTSGEVINCNSEKQKLLFYTGGMKNNGITSSMVNLLKNIDYTKYDVTCYTGFPRAKDSINNILAAPNEVRFIYKPGYALLDKTENTQLRKYNTTENNKNPQALPWQGLQKEAQRIFSNRHFDVAIDFSGYSFYWSKYILAADADKKACFMHSDMISDQNREVDGKKIHYNNLLSLFEVYDRYDKLITVSPIMKEVNEQGLKSYLKGKKIDYSLNTLDIDKLFNTSVVSQVAVESFVEVNYSVKLTDETITNLSVANTTDLAGSQRSIAINKDDTFRAIMEQKNINNEVILYKLLINEIYVGWVASSLFEKEYPTIVERRNVKFSGYVKALRNRILWKNLPLSEDTKMVGRAHYYRYLLVDVVEEALLSEDSTYFLIKRNGEELGWISSDSIEPIKNMALLRKLKNLVSNRKRLEKWEDRILETINETGFIKVKTDISNKDPWVESAQVDKEELFSQLPGHLFSYSQKVKTKYGWYYRLWQGSQFFGYVNERFLEEYFDFGILANKNVDRVITIEKNSELFDIETGELVGRTQDTEDKIVTKEVIRTDGIFYVIDEKYYLNKDNTLLKTNLYYTTLAGTEVHEPLTEDYNVVTMGRLSPEKNQDVLIESFKKVVNSYPNAKLFLLGDGPMRVDLLEKIRELSLIEHVFLLGHMDMPFDFIRKCDLFTLTSAYEGQPMVLLEAMSVGVPVSATDIPATQFVLENGKLGILAKENTVDGIADMLISAKENNIQPANFDAHEYNKKAVKMFFDVIG